MHEKDEISTRTPQKINGVMSNMIVPELLERGNYERWHKCMKSYLVSQDFWDIIQLERKPPRVDKKDWEKKNAAALHAIQISCDVENFNQINYFWIDSAKAAWDELESKHKKEEKSEKEDDSDKNAWEILEEEEKDDSGKNAFEVHKEAANSGKNASTVHDEANSGQLNDPINRTSNKYALEIHEEEIKDSGKNASNVREEEANSGKTTSKFQEEEANSGALAFDVEYARWLEEHNRQINELRAAVNSHSGDTELRTIVDNVTAHFDDIFRLKGTAAKADVFHILSGMWKTPAERCFMWIGGFRSSEILKLLVNQLEPLTEQQLVGIYNLQQSSQQAEDALSQGMEALQQSLAETLANRSSGNVANYMGQMAMAMGKLGTLEGFLSQADNLRQQTLQQLHRILTTRQSARALLAINDYFSRLRALSSLWLARPRE